MDKGTVLLLALVCGYAVVALLRRPSKKQIEAMGLEKLPSNERRSPEMFNLGLLMPFAALPFAVDFAGIKAYEMAFLASYIGWLILGFIVNFSLFAVPVDEGAPRSSLAGGFRTWCLAMIWPGYWLIRALAKGKA